MKQFNSLRPFLRWFNNHERTLIRKFRQGDDKAYRELLTPHLNALSQYVRCHVKSGKKSRELVKEICLVVWEHRDALRNHHSFPDFLFEKARQSVFLYFKKVVGDLKLQNELWSSLVVLKSEGEQAPVAKVYAYAIRLVHYRLLRLLLRNSLTIPQG